MVCTHTICQTLHWAILTFLWFGVYIPVKLKEGLIRFGRVG